MKRTGFFISALALAMAGVSGAAACEGRQVQSEHVYRSPVCVPAEPKRILVLDPTFSLGMAIELNLPVVAAPLFSMSDGELREKSLARSVVDIGSFLEPSIERIIAAKPDLIIGVDGYTPLYDLLSQVAPTVLIGGLSWRDHYEALALAAGRDDAVAGLFDAYDRRAAAIKARMPDVKVSVLRITSWDFQVFLDSPKAYAPFAVLRDAGVRRTAYETATGNESSKRPDWEGLAALEGDILLYIVGGQNNSDTNGRHEEVLGNPLWKMLPAVKSGRVHRVDAGLWMEFSGLTSANKILDDVERYILAAP
ncbi:iron-siderophore ABC transporter substrate-binding protein [Terrihabitans sp. B22-R8]|uniref:iron-siderophore ABC transporter substrate-binding protein n=1 Tax=Terrihabitans sp. B22-R8 TaxID=3425128 RepID=UPI00403C04AF